jgi:hypothetical protein
MSRLPYAWVWQSPAVPLALAGLLAVVAPGPSRPLSGQEKPPAEPTVTDRDASKENKPEWKPLFDGKTLEGWKVTDFGGQGAVEVEDGSIVLGMGSPLTGITYQREFPKCDYEIKLQARRLEGVDFFSTVTFPGRTPIAVSSSADGLAPWWASPASIRPTHPRMKPRGT